MQVWPRTRAKRAYPRITNAPPIKEAILTSFSGYKVGMTHIIAVDNLKNSPTKGQEIMVPVTIIECPPLNIFGVRFYQKTSTGLRIIGQVNSDSYDKVLDKRLVLKSKSPDAKEHKKLSKDDVIKIADKISKVNVLVHTNPGMTSIGKKVPEVMEVTIGGDIKSAINKAFELIGKQVNVGDVFKEGEQIDIFSVTTGKGWQGSVTRLGIKIAHHKTEHIRRKAMNLGKRSPKKLFHNAPQFGQMGYQSRVDYNKWLMKIDDADKINLKGGFVNYGLPRNKVLLLKGSVPGPKKRLIRLRKSIRPNSTIPAQPPQITYVSMESKQG